MPDPKSIAAEDLLQLLQKPVQATPPTQEQVLAAIASPAADRSRRTGLISSEDLIDVLEAGRPGTLERTIKGFAEFGKSLIDDTIDFAQRSIENAESLSLAALSTARVAPVREIPRFGTPQFGIPTTRTEEQVQAEKDALIKDALD
ncbi:hypothetical protein LCGC14_2795940, partial [marine sediment metagenome]